MQERQFSPFDSENPTPAERRVLRRARARRLQGLALGVGAGVLALFAIGCPGPADLANPQDYPVTSTTAGSAAMAGGSTGGATGASCDTDCIKDIFQKQATLCKLCHTAKAMADGGLQSSGLNLEADGFTDRLKNVAAKHTDLGTGMSASDCPSGDKLIDTANPSASWLLKKIQGTQGSCGTPMPSTGMLSAAQKTCMETYISCVAGGSITGGGGSGSGGTGGAASAGAATGGSGGSGGAATAGASSGGSGGTGGAKGGSGGTGGT